VADRTTLTARSSGKTTASASSAGGSVGAPPPLAARRRPPWYARPRLGLVLLLVALGAALAMGSGLGSSAPPTAAARAAAIDSQLRCPSCEDLSVAQSSASAAIAVRHEVARMVRAGGTDQQVEKALVAQYGSTILLRPPTSGLTGLVWLLPVVGAAAAAGVLGTLFWRRARQLRRLRDEAAGGAP
jgi:cytochrome c-type biogenesis protein CcmH